MTATALLKQSAGVTDTGRKRRRNEDAYVLAPPLFAVADGMGGAQAGEVASKLAAAAVEDTDHGSLRGERGIEELMLEANRRVYERSTEDPSAYGMGTTMTVALVEQGEVAIGHVGDSRAYLAREGRLEQLTEDHTLVNELIKSGRLSPDEAGIHPQRSVITRALGTEADVDVDTFTVPARPGDLFLICSDGLSSMVPDEAILDVLERNRDDLQQAATELVKAANRGGGDDNITVVAFEIRDADTGGVASEETARLPAAPEGVEPDDEDTLDGGLAAIASPAPIDATVPQAPLPTGPAETEGLPPRRGRRRIVPTLAFLLFLVAAGIAVALVFLR